jgi:hypothetical protein
VRVELAEPNRIACSVIESLLAQGSTLVDDTGAMSYEPFFRVERARLAGLLGDAAIRDREFREAHRLFLEIGAPIRAERVAKELAS